MNPTNVGIYSWFDLYDYGLVLKAMVTLGRRSFQSISSKT